MDRRQLNVEVWQVFVKGKKPNVLPGARDSAIRTQKVKVEKLKS